MSISKATLKTLQSLAALELDEGESQDLCRQLNDMRHWLSELLPASGSSGPGGTPEDSDRLGSDLSQPDCNKSLRDDLIVDSLPRSAVLQNSPDEWDHCYRVPPLHGLQDRDT